MKPQCRVLRHVVLEHLLLLLHHRHKIRQLYHDGGVLPKQAGVDYPGPHKLTPGLYKCLRLVHTIRC